MKLSETDFKNLEILANELEAVSILKLKGQTQGIQKLIKLELIGRHAWKGSYVYQITAKGRKALRDHTD